MNRRAVLGLGTAAALSATAGAVLGTETAVSAREAAGWRRPMPTGWCPGVRIVDGVEELETVAMRRQLDMYPDTKAFRIFIGPTFGLPPAAWTDPLHPLSMVPRDADVIVSWRDFDVDAAAFVEAWRAAGHCGRLILVPYHEPEQQTGGDPTPEQFRAAWSSLAEQVGGHPCRRSGRLLLAVCYTLVWARRLDENGQRLNDWRIWWPEHVARHVDLILGDWYPYDPTSATPFRPTEYQAPESALAIIKEMTSATGKGWGIAEINHMRVPSDPTGDACAAWYRQIHGWARENGCTIWTHFHKGGGDLENRLPERDALRDLIRTC
jgi:hypothetical protein